MKKFFASVVVMAAAVASAGECVWLGGNGKWIDKAKWHDGEVPAIGDSVQFPSNSGGTVDFDGVDTVTLSSITISGNSCPPAISHRNTRCVDRAGKYFLEYAA